MTSRGKMGIKSEDTSEKKRAKFSYFELQKANKITGLKLKVLNKE